MAKNQEAVGIPDIRRKDFIVPLRCGDCVFHARLATYARPCSELGTPPAARPCSRFVPDPAKLDVAEAVAVLSALKKASRLPLLMASMFAARRLRDATGFEVGQRVYFRVVGGDYLNNYARAVVVGAGPDGRVVLAGDKSFTAVVGTTTVLNREAWEAKRARLIKSGKLLDPDGGLIKIVVKNRDRLSVYEPAIAGTAATAKINRKKKREASPRKKNGPIVLNPTSSRERKSR